MKILVMGLPGSGKTHLSRALSARTGIPVLNADEIRASVGDYDFSINGRIRQANRMSFLASYYSLVICDFVCPTDDTRDAFNADFTVWVNTIQESRYSDTNALFQSPTEYDVQVLSHSPEWVDFILEKLEQKFGREFINVNKD